MAVTGGTLPIQFRSLEAKTTMAQSITTIDDHKNYMLFVIRHADWDTFLRHLRSHVWLRTNSSDPLVRHVVKNIEIDCSSLIPSAYEGDFISC